MSVSEPGKIITPWAESGLKNTIPPAANPATGRAGFDQGFSAINMTAKEAGGIPAFGQDFNGIFYEITNILRYMQAGGQPTFSSELATTIGGYPKGAMVLGSDGVTLWQSQIESNSVDPDIDPSNWGTFDIGLKAQLAAPGGAGLVGGLAKPVTWSGFAGGADPTGATASDAAFVAADATKRKIFVPAGTYLLNFDVVSDKDTTWVMEQNVTFIGAGRLRQVPWLVGLGGNIFHYLERTSRNTFIAPRDGTAVFGSAHTADGGSGGAALAVAGMAYNDDTSGTRSSVWGHYSTVVRGAAAIGASHGMEIDVANLGADVEMFPASMFPNGQTDSLWLASGGELTEAGVPVGNASAAIGIISNDATSNARFLKGIVFHNKSLSGTDGGSSGQAVAVAFANRHSVTWYNNSNQKTSEILSTSEDNAKSVRMNMSDFGVSFQKTAGGKTLFNIETGASTPANYFTMRYGAVGNPVTIAATGDDTNIDVLIDPKGAGSLNIDATVAPQIANTYTVGTSLRPWAGGFTQTAFTVTSDENYKTSPLEITDAMLDAAAEVDWCMFQYLDRIEAKGEDQARWHFGAMAQRFVEAFERHGLNAHDYAFICYDEWESSPEVIGDDGEILSPAIEAGSRYGIRYEQAIILKQKQIERDHKRQLDSLLSRVEALEKK